MKDHDSGGLGTGNHCMLEDEKPASYNAIKKRLVTHFDVANKKREVFWPTRDGTIRNYKIASSR